MRDGSAYTTDELAELYDAVYTYDADTGIWAAAASAAGGGPILELGCGTGRVLVPLAQAGYHITGLDGSGSMLTRCRSRLAEEPPDVRRRATLVRDDMRSFELGETFSLILCAFNTFHHLRTADDQLACLARCRSHLKPDGLLLLDLFNPDPAPTNGAPSSTESLEAPSVDETVVPMAGGRSVRRRMTGCVYDHGSQSNECEMTYDITEPDGSHRQVSERFALRLIYRSELEHLLARSGFRILEMYGDYERSPFDVHSLGMIVLAVPEG